jgi:hypothetical protein
VVTYSEQVLEMLEGATIVSARLDVEGEGLHLNLADGRVVIFIGSFTVGMARVDWEKLH